MNAIESPNAFLPQAAPHSQQMNHYESSKLVPWLMLTAILAGFGAGLSIWALIRAQTAERESRMLEYYVLEVDGKLMKSGIIDKGYEAWKREHDK